MIVRSLHAYCDGLHAIKARTPKNLDDKQRLRIAIGAMTSIGKAYSYSQVFQFWLAARRGVGFWAGMPKGPRINMRALVCSSLYQDAFAFAGAGMAARLGALCTPAHLSASTDFEERDPELGWLTIL